MNQFSQEELADRYRRALLSAQAPADDGTEAVQQGLSWGDIADATPIVSNVKGAIEGNWTQAALGGLGYPALKRIGEELKTPMTDAAPTVAGPSAAAATIYGAALGNAAKFGEYQGPGDITAARQGYVYTDNTNPDYTVEKQKVVGYNPTLATAGHALDKVDRVDTNVAAPQLGNAAASGASTVDRIKIDPLATAARGEQLAAIEAMKNAPSAAAAMYGAALQKIGGQQLGIANQARGADRAGARREAMLGMGSQGMLAADAAAAESAREEQAKRAAVIQGLAGLRGQDTDVATRQADIFANAAQTDAGNFTRVSESQAARADAAALERERLRLQGRQTEIQGGLAQQGNLGTLAAGDANRDTDVSTTNADLKTGAAKYGADATNTAEGNFANALTAKNAYGAGARVAQGAANTDRQNRPEEIYTKAVNDASVQNKANDLSVQQLRVSGTAGSLGQGNTAAGTMMQGAGIQVGADTEDANRSMKNTAGLIGAGGAIGSSAVTAFSDERVKEDIRPISDDDLMDFARKVHAVSFRYKPGTEDGGAEQHAGVLAQDLEKTRIGKSLVSEDPNGIRQVDYMGLTGLLAAAATKALRRTQNA